MTNDTTDINCFSSDTAIDNSTKDSPEFKTEFEKVCEEEQIRAWLREIDPMKIAMKLAREKVYDEEFREKYAKITIASYRSYKWLIASYNEQHKASGEKHPLGKLDDKELFDYVMWGREKV